MDKYNFNNVLQAFNTNFKLVDDFNKFLEKKKMTFRVLETSNPKISIYTLKYPYHNDEKMYDIDNIISNYLMTRYNIEVDIKATEPEPEPQTSPDDPNNDIVVVEDHSVDSFDYFGRGLLLRVDSTDSENTKYSLVGCPIPFADLNITDLSTNTNEATLNNCVASFVIDGTGITVCKDIVDNKLVVSTRSVSGYYPDGPTNSYGNPNYSYGKMFRETLQENPNNETSLINLDPNYILHFVLEHKHSFKVIPCQNAHLTLVNVFKIDRDTNQISYVPVSEFQKQFGTNFNEVSSINLGDTNESRYHVIDNIINTSVVPGVKLFNPTTLQWSPRLYTKSFMLRKQLRGNTYNPVYNIIKVRHMSSKIYDMASRNEVVLPDTYESPLQMYFKLYPEHIAIGNNVKTDIYKFTSTLLNYYLDRHVHNKLQNDDEIAYEFRDLVNSLHFNYKRNMWMYKNGQMQDVPRTTNATVSSFVNLMHPSRLYDRISKFNAVV